MSNESYIQKWYKKNKDKHLNYMLEKVKCKCGRQIARASLNKHLKTDYHNKWLEERAKYRSMVKQQMGGSKSKRKIIKVPKELDEESQIEVDHAKINADPKLKKKHIKQLLQKGRIEIEDKDQLESFPLGSLVSYETIDDKYRGGGFLKAIMGKYFVLTNGKISWSVQFDKTKRMWVKNPFAVEKHEESDKDE